MLTGDFQWIVLCAYIDHGLLGLHHVWDDSICDHQQNKVLWPVRHVLCTPAHSNRTKSVIKCVCFIFCVGHLVGYKCDRVSLYVFVTVTAYTHCAWFCQCLCHYVSFYAIVSVWVCHRVCVRDQGTLACSKETRFCQLSLGLASTLTHMLHFKSQVITLKQISNKSWIIQKMCVCVGQASLWHYVLFMYVCVFVYLAGNRETCWIAVCLAHSHTGLREVRLESRINYISFPLPPSLIISLSHTVYFSFFIFSVCVSYSPYLPLYSASPCSLPHFFFTPHIFQNKCISLLIPPSAWLSVLLSVNHSLPFDFVLRLCTPLSLFPLP